MSKEAERFVAELTDSMYLMGHGVMTSLAAGFNAGIDREQLLETYMLESNRHLWPRWALALTLFIFLTALIT